MTIIAKGGEAEVYKRYKASPHRKMLRKTTWSSSNVNKHPKVIFYTTKIAQLLHPESFVNFSTVRLPRNKKVQKLDFKETEFYSREVKTSATHRRMQQELMKARPDYWVDFENTAFRQGKKIDPEGLAKKRADQLKIEGFEVDAHLGNVDIIKGKPFLFEVTAKDPKKIREYVIRKRIKGNFTAAKKARALRLANRLIEIFDSLSIQYQIERKR